MRLQRKRIIEIVLIGEERGKEFENLINEKTLIGYDLESWNIKSNTMEIYVVFVERDGTLKRELCTGSGYEKDMCSECGWFAKIRQEDCVQCENCGATSEESQ